MNKKNRWFKDRQIEIIQWYGSRCNNPLCQRHYNLGVKPLEFAHIQENGLSGVGRGRADRILSLMRNLKRLNEDGQEYVLLCPECHDKFDKRTVREYKLQKRIEEATKLRDITQLIMNPGNKLRT